MPNRQLTKAELAELFQPLINDVRIRIAQLSNGDEALLWALRRKLAKELVYDERSKPAQRKRLKALKRIEQDGKCAICKDDLPEKNVVLDRFEAMAGYTLENTRLLCQACDFAVQSSRGFS